MGQRLNIEIKKKNKILANAYYHWSGYSDSALELTKMIVDKIDEINYEDDVVEAIKLLEITESGLTENEMKYAKENIKDFDKFDFIHAMTRNHGLTAISDYGIKETRSWEEARVTIDIEKKIINFNAFYKNAEKEFKEWHEEININELLKYDIDIENLKFEQLKELENMIEFLKDNYDGCFRLTNDNKNIYEIIY